MAARTTKVEVEITATDEASPKIDRLEKRIDGLEADEARIVVTAQMGRTEQQLDDARRKLEQLDGDEATVQARLVGTLEQDLADANRLFEQLDGKTGTVTMKADTSDAESKLTKIAGAAGMLPGRLGQAAASMSGSAGLVAGGTALAGALFAAADSAADMAIQAKVTAELTGASVEEASRLQAVWKMTGADFNDLNDILLQMNGALKQAPEIAEQLGINLNDGADGIARMLELLDKVNDSTLSASEKAAIFSTSFGEEGVRQMSRLLVLFPDLEQAMADVSDARAFDDEDAENAREFSAETAELKGQLISLGTAIGTKVIPPFTEFIDMLDGGTEQFDLAAFGLETFDKAAAAFDLTLLDGLKTFGQVRAKVVELTGSEYLAQLVALRWQKAQDELNAGIDAGAASLRDFLEAQREIGRAAFVAQLDGQIKAAIDLQQRLDAINDELHDMARATEELRAARLADALDVGDDALDTLTAIQNINSEIRDLAAWVAEHGIPNIFDVTDVNADDFLSDIQRIKGPIQEQVVKAFDEQGAAAAQAMANSFAKTLSVQLGISLTDALNLLGLTNLTGKINIASPPPNQVSTMGLRYDTVRPGAATNVTIYNPPGTPAATYDQFNAHLARNGTL
jgi:hypothetical protein